MSSIAAIGGSITSTNATLLASVAKAPGDKDGDKDGKVDQSRAGADKDGDAAKTVQLATSATLGSLLSIST